MLTEVLISEEQDAEVLAPASIEPPFIMWADASGTPVQNRGEVVQLEKALLSTVLREIENTEDVLRTKEIELAAAMADNSVRLGVILELKRAHADLGAYLKGLRFSQTALSRQLEQ